MTKIKAPTRKRTSRRKLIALADATLALNQQPLPHDMPALIAELMGKPALVAWDFSLLNAKATENAWAKAAASRRDWLAGLEGYRDAVGAVLAGADGKRELRRLKAALA